MAVNADNFLKAEEKLEAPELTFKRLMLKIKLAQHVRKVKNLSLGKETVVRNQKETLEIFVAHKDRDLVNLTLKRKH